MDTKTETKTAPLRYRCEQRKSFTVHDELAGWWDVIEDSEGVVRIATRETFTEAHSIMRALQDRAEADAKLRALGVTDYDRETIELASMVSECAGFLSSINLTRTHTERETGQVFTLQTRDWSHGGNVMAKRAQALCDKFDAKREGKL